MSSSKTTEKYLIRQLYTKVQREVSISFSVKQTNPSLSLSLAEPKPETPSPLMGCSQSKIENEEAVSRCKERKQFMKEAVKSRNAFAAAHSSYTMALKNTGAALSDYGHGEVIDIRPTTHPAPLPPPPPLHPLPRPPPPLPEFPPLQRAATMPELSIPIPEPKPTDTIQEEEDDDLQLESDEIDAQSHDLSHHRRHRSRQSGIDGGGGGGGGGGGAIVEEAPPPPPLEVGESTFDFFFPNHQDMPGSYLNESDEIRVNKDENDGGRVEKISETLNVDGGIRSVGSSSSSSNVVEEPQMKTEKVIQPATVAKTPKRSKQVVSVPVEGNKRVVKGVSSVSLLQILNELDEFFLKASQSAHEVSKLLEANRLHYHSNFADNRGHIDHSAKLMRVITWNRSFQGLQNPEDVDDDVDKNETLATVLDKLLAWEKKLYDEVKAGELMKFEYQRRLGLLNKQKDRGTNPEALEKTKAAVNHLHTRYIVDMQSMDSTVSEINQLRDDKLYPKLLDLVNGMAKMWEAMNMQHNNKLKIVEHLKALDTSQSPKETSEEHHKRTIQLWTVVKDWHSHFENLLKYKKQYVKVLNNWLKQNLVPIESNLKEKVSSPPRIPRPPIQPLLLTWNDYLEKLPDDLARNAIFSFAAIMDAIKQNQQEELEQKMICEDLSNELRRKTRAFEDWQKKYLQRRTQSGDVDPERSEDPNHKDPVAEKKFVIESLKIRLEEEAKLHQKLCTQVREKSLGSLKTHLPELFRALSEFSFACSEMYKKLQSVAQPDNVAGSLS